MLFLTGNLFYFISYQYRFRKALKRKEEAENSQSGFSGVKGHPRKYLLNKNVFLAQVE